MILQFGTELYLILQFTNNEFYVETMFPNVTIAFFTLNGSWQVINIWGKNSTVINVFNASITIRINGASPQFITKYKIIASVHWSETVFDKPIETYHISYLLSLYLKEGQN